MAAWEAFTQGRALVAAIEQLNGSDIDAFKAQVESLAPVPPRGRAAFFRGRGASAGPPTLYSVGGRALPSGPRTRRRVTPIRGHPLVRGSLDDSIRQERGPQAGWAERLVDGGI